MCTTTVPAPTAEPAPAGDERPLVRYERGGKIVQGHLERVTDAALCIDLGWGYVTCWLYGKFDLTRVG